jgi:hypothetical protein
MKRSTFASYLTAAVLALGTVPALAQEAPPANAPVSNGGASGGRPSGGSGGSGTATGSRPSGGGGGSAVGSSGSSAGSSSSSGGSSSSTPSTGGGSLGGEFSRPRAPERRGGNYAVPRGDTETSFGGRPATNRATSSTAGLDATSDQRRAVPAYSRPREGRPVIGNAVERTSVPGGGGTGGGNVGNGYPYYPYYPYYDPYYGYPGRYAYGYGYGPWYGGYGFGLGYFYDPFGYYGYYSPYNDEYGGAGYGTGQYNYRNGYGRAVGQLRLKVNPRHGQVYVDGYYAGEVDNFDGMFQRLSIEAGAHKVEIRAEGYETVTFDVMVTPGETVTYKGELKQIR